MGGTIGGVVVIICAVIGIVYFVRRRRSTTPGPVSSDSAGADLQMIVTPRDPNSSAINEDSGFSAEQQTSVIGDPEVEMVAHPRRPLLLPAVSPLLPPDESDPVGLSNEELLQELLRRSRAENPSSPLLHSLQVSTSSASLPASSPAAGTELSVATVLHHTLRLHSEVNSIRSVLLRVLEDMDRNREEGFASGSRSNYTSGDEV